MVVSLAHVITVVNSLSAVTTPCHHIIDGRSRYLTKKKFNIFVLDLSV